MAKVTQLGFIEDNSIGTPESGIVNIYAKSDSLLYFKNDAGVELPIGTGSGSGSVTNVSSANADLTVASPTSTPVLTVVQAPAIRSATTTVNVSSATAPTSGQVLTATSGTAATWQTPAGGALGPTFNAQASGQTITAGNSATFAVSEIWDTNTNFASNTFTPTVEGYYYIQVAFNIGVTARLISVQLQGTFTGADLIFEGTVTQMNATALIYMNGSTDNVSVLINNGSGSSITISSATPSNCFTGFLARGV